MDELSILNAVEQSQNLAAQSEDTMTALGVALAKKIPKELELFATKLCWIKTDPFDRWMLIGFLENLIKNMKRGRHNRLNISKDRLDEFGFTDADDARNKIAMLANAWDNLIRIETDEFSDTVAVMFYSTEN